MKNRIGTWEPTPDVHPITWLAASIGNQARGMDFDLERPTISFMLKLHRELISIKEQS